MFSSTSEEHSPTQTHIYNIYIYLFSKTYIYIYIYIYIYTHTHICIHPCSKKLQSEKICEIYTLFVFSNQKVSLFDEKTKDMYFMYIFKLHLWKGVYILFYLHDIKQIVDSCKDVTDIDILWTG